MRRHKVLVRQLDAIETLGAVQVMCMDKTGTLTLNRMSVLAVHTAMRRLDVRDRRLTEGDALVEPAAAPELQRLLHVCVLCNETEVNGERESLTLNGSATEAALLRFAMDMGVSHDDLRQRYPLAATEYRSHNRNYMRTVHEAGDGARLIAVKGAPAEVLGMCRWHVKNGETEALGDTERAAILAENDRMARQALRVLGCAYCREMDPGRANGELIWVGLIGLADPIRDGIVELIEQFHRAGIKTAMVTGDQSATAYAIGKQLRLSGRDDLNVVDSIQLETLEPQAVATSAQRVDVFARVSPVHKLRIVQALQDAGCVVAMTGDGINDGPALRAADIGVAMGEAGTDLARSVADIILEDDNLQAMIVAISEGRTSYDNIRKAVHFLVSSNLSEIWLTLSSVAAGLGTPLTPMQLLWINLMTDVFPALALALEPPESDVLQRPPRDPTERIIGRTDLARFTLESGVLTAACLGAYGYGRLRYGPGSQASTIAFMSVGLAQLAHTYSCRSERHGLFNGELRRNRWLDIAVGGSSIAQILTSVAPVLRSVLGTAPLRVTDFAVSALAAAGPYLINEGLKASRNRRPSAKEATSSKGSIRGSRRSTPPRIVE
jgi:Ca2+-transporting ATPase